MQNIPPVPRTALSFSGSSGVANPNDTISSNDRQYSPEAKEWYRQKYGFSPYTANDPEWRKMVTYMRHNPQMMMRMLPQSPPPRIPKHVIRRLGTG